MSKSSAFIFLLFAVFTFPAWGQSTLEPPMQADVHSHQVIHAPDPSAMPVFQLATAELNADGRIEIRRTNVKQELLAPLSVSRPNLNPQGIQITEKVPQTYTVQIPYIENIDGKQVKKFRAEQRTRIVTVTKFRQRTPAEEKEFQKKIAEQKKSTKAKPEVQPARRETVRVKQRIMIPQTKMIDGQAHTVPVQVERLVAQSVLRGKSKTSSTVEATSLDFDKARFFAASGEELGTDKVRERLQDRVPAVVTNAVPKDFEYFTLLLKPQAIIIVMKLEP